MSDVLLVKETCNPYIIVGTKQLISLLDAISPKIKTLFHVYLY